MDTLREDSHMLVQALGQMSRLAGPPPLKASRRHIETIAVKNDPTLMTALKRSERDIEEGRTYEAREVFEDLGW